MSRPREEHFIFLRAARIVTVNKFLAGATHMLEARTGRGFDLDDLIAAFEQEAHQNVAQFVRLWMKHPGVPKTFVFVMKFRGILTSDTAKESIREKRCDHRSRSKPIGPYSQAIKRMALLLVGKSRSIPRARTSGRRNPPANRAVLENIKGILEAAGGISTTSSRPPFPEGHERFPGHERVYARYFTSAPPPSTTVRFAPS